MIIADFIDTPSRAELSANAWNMRESSRTKFIYLASVPGLPRYAVYIYTSWPSPRRFYIVVRVGARNEFTTSQHSVKRAITMHIA